MGPPYENGRLGAYSRLASSYSMFQESRGGFPPTNAYIVMLSVILILFTGVVLTSGA